MLNYDLAGSPEGLDAAQQGGPPPMVLLHAFPLDRTMWQPVAEIISEVITCVLVDLPGFGASPLPVNDQPFSDSPAGETGAGPAHQGVGGMDQAADAVATLLGKLGVSKALVAGVSMGGYVAMGLAQRHPELLAGLALIDTVAHADPPEKAAHRHRIAATVAATGTRALLPMMDTLVGEATRARHPARVQRVRDLLLRADPRAVVWAQEAMAVRPDRMETLSRLRVPASVIVGEQDALVSMEQARAMNLMLADSRLEVISDAGHLSPLERPHEVARALVGLSARLG